MNINEFNIGDIQPYSNILIIGKRNVGKTVFMRDLLKHYCTHTLTIFSTTHQYVNNDPYRFEEMEDMRNYKKYLIETNKIVCNTTLITKDIIDYIIMNYMPEMYIVFKDDNIIYDDYNPIVIDHIMERQKISSKENEVCVVFDEILHNNISKDNDLRNLMMNNRHLNIGTISSMPYCMGLKPEIRGSIDYIFIFRVTNINERRKLYQHYVGMFPTFNAFNQAIDICTANFGCLVVDNITRGNLITDQIFRYKTDIEKEESIKIKYKQLGNLYSSCV